MTDSLGWRREWKTMDSQEVGVFLEECLLTASTGLTMDPTEEVKLDYRMCTESLSIELRSLLQEAVDMKWPFVPERWQYKQSLTSLDKTNLEDLISQYLPKLLALLKAAILAREGRCAVAVVFLVDRYLYWMDGSSKLLKIAKALHRHHPGTPIAPQLVIRQARVYLNLGKLQKAEFILSSLINNSGATGCWVYHLESDRTLVQAVCVQVRGLILQKLGLWLEAAELIWASLVGYYALPQPDKKGIGTSLGLLASILESMSDTDFEGFRANPDIDLSFLGDSGHRLLCAAEAVKMGVLYCQYTSLYVLNNVVIQGTCLLSYSFSSECPSSERRPFLLQAKEAFEIGLLTKTERDPVTSKQELHALLRAAYSLVVAHKWLGSPAEAVAQAREACREAVEKFYTYGRPGGGEKGALCAEIMRLVACVKSRLRVAPFPNSDEGSFVPDGYRKAREGTAAAAVGAFTLDAFSRAMGRFRQHHASVCEASEAGCRGGPRAGPCITALGTTVDAERAAIESQKDGPRPPLAGRRELRSTAGGAEEPAESGGGGRLGFSWQNVPAESTGSPPGGSGRLAEDGSDDGAFEPVLKSGSRVASSPSTGSDVRGFEMIDEQCLTETVGSEEPWFTCGGGAVRRVAGVVATQSGSSFGSLGDSFGSRSSWEKLSLSDPHSPVSTGRIGDASSAANDHGSLRHQPSANSQPSDRSRLVTNSAISAIETSDGPIGEAAIKEEYPAAPEIEGEFKIVFHPRNVHRFSARETEAETGSLPIGSNPSASSAPDGLSLEQCLSTEIGSSFELVDKEMERLNIEESCCKETQKPPNVNPSCYICLNRAAMGSVAHGRQYVLTRRDYDALLAGVCHACLLRRLQSDGMKFQRVEHQRAHCALQLKYSRVTELWTAHETYAYIGEPTGQKGQQRMAVWVQSLHQEERLSSYVAKEYLKPKEMQFHLNDVERQMTAQYYVTQFNKTLYNQELTAQIFFIPSEVLLILEGDEIVGCVTMEPYMLGDFVKLTNNTSQVVKRLKATEYGIAFGHFTYLYSNCQEVVVDLQGWVTANGKGLTYLTDPQLHSLRVPRSATNFAERGLRYFLEEQHGPKCNEICKLLKLAPIKDLPRPASQKQ